MPDALSLDIDNEILVSSARSAIKHVKVLWDNWEDLWHIRENLSVWLLKKSTKSLKSTVVKPISSTEYHCRWQVDLVDMSDLNLDANSRWSYTIQIPLGVLKSLHQEDQPSTSVT